MGKVPFLRRMTQYRGIYRALLPWFCLSIPKRFRPQGDLLQIGD